MRKPWIQTFHGLGCLKHAYKPCLICGSHNYSIHVCVTFVAGHTWLDCTVISQHTCIGTFHWYISTKFSFSFMCTVTHKAEILILRNFDIKFCAQIECVTFVVTKLCCTWIANHDGATVYTSLIEPLSFRLYIFQLFYLRKSDLILQW